MYNYYVSAQKASKLLQDFARHLESVDQLLLRRSPSAGRNSPQDEESSPALRQRQRRSDQQVQIYSSYFNLKVLCLQECFLAIHISSYVGP